MSPPLYRVPLFRNLIKQNTKQNSFVRDNPTNLKSPREFQAANLFRTSRSAASNEQALLENIEHTETRKWPLIT